MRDMWGVIIIDRIGDEEVRRRCGSELSIGERMDRNVLRWYCSALRKKKERMVQRMCMAKVDGSRGRKGRNRGRWMDGVKAGAGRKGLNIEDVKMCI
jgi:hypothetical protein